MLAFFVLPHNHAGTMCVVACCMWGRVCVGNKMSPAVCRTRLALFLVLRKKILISLRARRYSTRAEPTSPYLVGDRATKPCFPTAVWFALCVVTFSRECNGNHLKKCPLRSSPFDLPCALTVAFPPSCPLSTEGCSRPRRPVCPLGPCCTGRPAAGRPWWREL